MNTSGQGSFGFIFSLLFFGIVWFVWLGGWLNYVGQFFITSQGLTGIEAIIMGNFNLVVLIAIFMGVIGYSYLKQ